MTEYLVYCNGEVADIKSDIAKAINYARRLSLCNHNITIEKVVDGQTTTYTAEEIL